MRVEKKNKKKGFVFVFVVILLAIILAIFFNYSMSARARKEFKEVTISSGDLQESASQALAVGIFEAYIIDQMIAKNQESVQDYLGYFIVKDIPQNKDAQIQSTSVKVWEEDKSPTNKHNTGPWTLSDQVKASKGGYFIKTIKNMDNGNVIYEANSDGTRKSGYSGDPINQELNGHYSGKNNPRFEVEMYKKIVLEANGAIVREYDATVVLDIYYSTGATSSKNIQGMKEKNNSTTPNPSSSVKTYQVVHIGP